MGLVTKYGSDENALNAAVAKLLEWITKGSYHEYATERMQSDMKEKISPEHFLSVKPWVPKKNTDQIIITYRFDTKWMLQIEYQPALESTRDSDLSKVSPLDRLKKALRPIDTIYSNA